MPDFARLRAKRLFLLDLDGTLYLDERLFDGAADFLRAIRSRGGTYRFLTNNSSRGAESYVEKLRRNQLERIRPCLSCQEACMGRIQKFSSVCCAVNPAVGREVAYAVVT